MTRKFNTPVTPLSVTPGSSISELVAGMGGTSFQARSLSHAVDIWAQMITEEVTIFFGLAGAMVPAGMRGVMVYLVQHRFIDCLVSTGANLFHDLHESLGRHHWHTSPCVDDDELASSRIYRIHDVVTSAPEFDSTEDFVIDFASTLERDRAYTTQEFYYLIGKALLDQGAEQGILSACAAAAVPIYCPAPGDSVFGAALAGARVKRGVPFLFDVVKDIVELVQIVTAASASGVIFVGGGTPKNFIQQAQLCGDLFDRELKGHRYAIQVTTDSPQWGGLSGCTFEEARSWCKVAPQAPTATVNCDATIALPIMASALAERCADTIEHRARPTFTLGPELAVG